MLYITSSRGTVVWWGRRTRRHGCCKVRQSVDEAEQLSVYICNVRMVVGASDGAGSVYTQLMYRGWWRGYSMYIMYTQVMYRGRGRGTPCISTQAEQLSLMSREAGGRV